MDSYWNSAIFENEIFIGTEDTEMMIPHDSREF